MTDKRHFLLIPAASDKKGKTVTRWYQKASESYYFPEGLLEQEKWPEVTLVEVIWYRPLLQLQERNNAFLM